MEVHQERPRDVWNRTSDDLPVPYSLRGATVPEESGMGGYPELCRLREEGCDPDP